MLVYSGVPAEMYLANNNPQADRAICENAAESIRRINPKRVVLISTIAVLDTPVSVNEDAEIDESKLTTYGSNRLHLERLVAGSVEHCHIIRLPALFGNGIKKNFIYDVIHYLPAMLSKSKFAELSAKEPSIAENYTNQGNGFYRLNVSDKNRSRLKSTFERTGFSALSFTDNRSRFQFYNLANLWGHIIVAIENKLPLLHTAAAPLRMGIYFALEREYDGVITIDGNNKDSIEDACRFVKKLDECYDFVQGSRFVKGGKAINTPAIRHIAVKLIHAPIISYIAGERFTDTTNAFRAYSRKYLTHPEVQPLRDVFVTYELLAYLSVRASQLGLRTCEVPVTRAYPPKGEIPTKISFFKGNSDLMRILLENKKGRYNP